MKIAVIGAGGAGLCAARHCLQQNLTVDVFEQTGQVGGTWTYTDHIGHDENGIPVHSSMYKGLRTNLPKELMAFEDFPYPQQERSYLHQHEVLAYIRDYTEKFQIKPCIKFHKRVVRVEPLGGRWLVEVEDVLTRKNETGCYDAVIVCNGHYKESFIPVVPGVQTFKGGSKHSHDYRSPDSYKDKRVLVVGAGPSGTDIAQQILGVATKVYLSHKSTTHLPLPENLVQKPVLNRLEGTTAIFEDGTSENIDEVLYCTGYNYSFPFLSNCGIVVEDNYVSPLYKQVIDIEHPTLAFIGVPFIVCPFPMFDVQVRFFLSSLNGHFKIPSREEMYLELKEETERKKLRPKRKYHELGEDQGRYFDDLATTAGIKPVPPVIHKLYMRVRMSFKNLENCFRIVDDDNFEQIR